jgi:hypothetical protein
MSEKKPSNNPDGAPTKYKEDIPERLIEFFSRDLFVQVDGGKTMPNRLPTIERFCSEIDIVTSTFYEWCKKYPELSSAFNKAKQYQKDQLMQLALMGFYKEGFAKFVAVNITDMRDKVESQVEQSTEIKLSYK